MKQALEHHQAAFAIGEKYDHVPWMGLADFGIGKDYHGLGKNDLAHDYLNKSLKTFRTHGLFARVTEVKQYMDKHGYEEMEK